MSREGACRILLHPSQVVYRNPNPLNGCTGIYNRRVPTSQLWLKHANRPSARSRKSKIKHDIFKSFSPKVLSNVLACSTAGGHRITQLKQKRETRLRARANAHFHPVFPFFVFGSIDRKLTNSCGRCSFPSSRHWLAAWRHTAVFLSLNVST